MPSLQVAKVVEPFANAGTHDDEDDDKTAEMSLDGEDSPPFTEPSSRGKEESPCITSDATNKRRRVTPVETTATKQQQQKKVNQMQLSFFFHKATSNKVPSLSGRGIAGKTVLSQTPTEMSCSKDRTTEFNLIAQKSTGSGDGRRKRRCVAEDEPAEAKPSSLSLGTSNVIESIETNPSESALGHKEVPKIIAASEIQATFTKNQKTIDDCILQVESVDHKRHDATKELSTSMNPTEVLLVDATSYPEIIELDCDSSDDEVEVDDERKALLEKHSDIKQRCQQRSEELVQVAREGIEEEDFEMPSLERVNVSSDEDFPDAVVNNMAILIEGSHLPLSKLAALICQQLKECHHRVWSTEAVITKIKLVAERKPYLDSISTFRNDVAAKYEDISVDRMWRWELGIIDVLPSSILPKIRKARSARRKLLSYHLAIQKLLKSIEDVEAVIRERKTDGLESAILKVGADEEKVLKFEREAEKKRLEQLARRKKDEEFEAKKREKERKKEKLEKKKLEKEKEKLELTEAREAEKRQKMEERERQIQQKKMEAEQKKELLSKQKACLMSFFAASKEIKGSKQTFKTVPHAGAGTESDHDSSDFDVDQFRSLIDSLPPPEACRPLFPTLSTSAIESRKRRTRRVPVSVYVTVMPDSNAFEEQPFAEQRIIQVPNKYRFLSFHEDYRPPYHGTWSKRSKIVTGKTPFAKDTTHLDYDYDSEAEWEEGDDEIGEDVEDDTKDQEDDEEEAKMYDYDDGFCVADDQYLDIDEDVDEETKALYKKKLQRGDSGFIANRVCIIAPSRGGVPVSENTISERTEGFGKDEALVLLKTHTGKQICHDSLWLDAFAPDKIYEPEPAIETETSTTTPGNRDDLTVEEMTTLATFAHHCTLSSKEKLIEELRNANPNLFTSRAKVTRKLDSIAEKKRHPYGFGVYWEVNKQLLEELELDALLAKPLHFTAADTAMMTPSTNTVEQSSEQHLSFPADTSLVPKTSSSQSKKRSIDSTSALLEPFVESLKTTKESKGSSVGRVTKKTVSPSSLASVSVMMNFLQPRKKPKDNLSTTKT